MPTKELRAKYRKSNQSAALNAAIRAELPGGGLVLDLLELTHHAADRLGWREGDGPSLPAVIHGRLREAANEMEAEIRRRYGLPVRNDND